MAYSVEKPDADLRGYLHAKLADFVQRTVNNALRDRDPEFAAYARKVHQARLDAFLEGREVRHIRRWDLPDWHPESSIYGGDADDLFTLGPEPDDVLTRDEVKTPAFVPPNRAERRAAGWRGPGLNGNGSG